MNREERQERYTGWFYRLPISLFIRIPAAIPLMLIQLYLTISEMICELWEYVKEGIQEKWED